MSTEVACFSCRVTIWPTLSLFNLQWVLSPKYFKFPYPITLTMIHMGFSAAVAVILVRVLKVCLFFYRFFIVHICIYINTNYCSINHESPITWTSHNTRSLWCFFSLNPYQINGISFLLSFPQCSFKCDKVLLLGWIYPTFQLF